MRLGALFAQWGYASTASYQDELAEWVAKASHAEISRMGAATTRKGGALQLTPAWSQRAPVLPAVDAV